MALHARLLLKSRGIRETMETLAGALLEAERDQYLVATMKTWLEIQKALAKQSRAK